MSLRWALIPSTNFLDRLWDSCFDFPWQNHKMNFRARLVLKCRDSEKISNCTVLWLLQKLPKVTRGSHWYHQPIVWTVYEADVLIFPCKDIKGISEQDGNRNEGIANKLVIAQHFGCYKTFLRLLEVDADTTPQFFGPFRGYFVLIFPERILRNLCDFAGSRTGISDASQQR